MTRTRNWPTLYKKTSIGQTQYWNIRVNGNIIETAYGKVGGKEVITSDVIKAGKNIGKSNETTPHEQAVLEADSQWTGKLKKGYVKTIEGAQAEEKDEIVQGGYDVMLAHDYNKRGKDMPEGCYCQPKLDGGKSRSRECSAMVART